MYLAIMLDLLQRKRQVEFLCTGLYVTQILSDQNEKHSNYWFKRATG